MYACFSLVLSLHLSFFSYILVYADQAMLILKLFYCDYEENKEVYKVRKVNCFTK